MDLLQNIDPASAPLLLCGLCALCLVGVVLLFGLQIIGGLLGAVGDILEIFIGLLSGGPAEWCGCLLFLIGLGICGGLIVLISSGLSACESNPTNFCALFGR